MPIIFFIDNAINISDQEIVENLNSYPDDLNRNVDEILIVRDYKEVSEIKKNYLGTTYVAAQVTSNITSDKQNVNNDTENDNPVLSFQTVTNPAEIERIEKEPTVKAYSCITCRFRRSHSFLIRIWCYFKST